MSGPAVTRIRCRDTRGGGGYWLDSSLPLADLLPRAV
jgi:hypothetical protein